MEEDKNRNLMGGKKGTSKKEHNLDSVPGWEALEKRLNEMEKKPLSKVGRFLEARKERSFQHTVLSIGMGFLGLGLGNLFGPWLAAWTPFLIAGGSVLVVWGFFMLYLSNTLWWLRMPEWLQLLIVVVYGITTGGLAWLLANTFQQ